MTILEHHQTIFVLICPLVLGLHNDGNITPQFTDVTQPFYSCYFKSSKYRAYQCSKSMKNMIFQEVYCKEYIRAAFYNNWYITFKNRNNQHIDVDLCDKT